MSYGDFAEAAGLSRLAGRPLTPAILGLPYNDPAVGYRAQSALTEWFSTQGHGHHAGYKIGATTSLMRNYLGVDEPLCGRLLYTGRADPGGVLQVPGDCPIGLECELAFTFADDLPETDIPWTHETILPYLASCHAALEVAENRYGDFRSCPVWVIVADDVFQRGYVLGAPSEWHGTDLSTITGRLSIDGHTVQKGRGAEVMGNPLQAVTWLANASPRIGCPLRRGHVVLTGSMHLVYWLGATPAKVGVEIDGIGSFQVTVERKPT